jgi:hypothetical protein
MATLASLPSASNREQSNWPKKIMVYVPVLRQFHRVSKKAFWKAAKSGHVRACKGPAGEVLVLPVKLC